MSIEQTTSVRLHDSNVVLFAGILDILRNDWGNRCGEFEAYWFGYEALKDALHENLIYVDVATIKVAMKELAKQNKVELRPTYNQDWKISGRGWFACT
jgi:hypothetical protein